MKATYSESFREKMVRQMLGPKAVTATQLAKEVGVAQPTLSKWLRAAQRQGMATKNAETPVPTKSPSVRSAEDKIRLVLAAEGLGPDELGAFLRREGLHEAELAMWRSTIRQALGNSPAPLRSVDSKRIKQLERELRRKDKALAEAAALLVLSKKAQALWGDGDGGTDEESEK